MSHHQDKINLILSASQKRFGRYGMSKTTMNDIADDVGMCKASLYYYFKDKESIFIAVTAKEQNDFAQKMRKTLEADTTAKKMLCDYTVFRIKLLQKLLTVAKLSHENYKEVKPLMHTLTISFKKNEVSIISEILKIGKERKEFKVADISASSQLFIDILRGLRQEILSGLIEKGIYPISPKDYRKLREQSTLFTEIFIKGLYNR